MIWKCLIVDDEAPARRIIERYLSDLPNYTVVGQCKDALEAQALLQQQEVDIMFLDINMPKLSGLSFLRSLKNPPAVILTTAYRDYALEGYELDVIDYLKKPFAFERFLMAVNKAVERLVHGVSAVRNPSNIELDTTTRRNFLFVKEDKVTYKVNMGDILFIESVGDYNKIYTPKKVFLTYQTLKKLQELLPGKEFPRIHKSYIIALSKIDNIIGNQITIAGSNLPIGQSYRKKFFELIEEY